MKSTLECPFCGTPMKRGDMRPYIYPIPICKAFPSGGAPNEGTYSCINCLPIIRELQFKQGLLVIGYNDEAKEPNND